MHDHSDFFGNVFEDPDDDPLLGSEEDEGASSDEASDADDKGPPSWVSDEQRNGRSSEAGKEEPEEAQKKEIVLDVGTRSSTGLEAINQAVGQGWRLVRISLTRPEGDQVAKAEVAHRIVATLEKENPQSLFDFGSAA